MRYWTVTVLWKWQMSMMFHFSRSRIYRKNIQGNTKTYRGLKHIDTPGWPRNIEKQREHSIQSSLYSGRFWNVTQLQWNYIRLPLKRVDTQQGRSYFDLKKNVFFPPVSECVFHHCKAQVWHIFPEMFSSQLFEYMAGWLLFSNGNLSSAAKLFIYEFSGDKLLREELSWATDWM